MFARTANKAQLSLSLVLVTIISALLVSCETAGGSKGTEDEMSYTQITQEEAKGLMESEASHVILDVRTAEEYAAGHIPGAILIPDNEIGARAEAALSDKDELILVYCRSGRRSKLAAAELASFGYSNVKEFGGIIDWKYDIVTE